MLGKFEILIVIIVIDMNLKVNVKNAANLPSIERSVLDANNSVMNGNAQNVKFKPKHTETINLISNPN